MPTRLPDYVDPYRLALKAESLSGDMALASMKRLAQELVDNKGSVAVQLDFSYDEQRRAMVNGRITTVLTLKCERCLGPMLWPLESEFTLVIIREGDPGEIPPEYEQYIMESDRVRLDEMIEDEILLSLPIVPRHADEDCPAMSLLQSGTEQQDAGQQDTERNNPFEVLKDLKSE